MPRPRKEPEYVYRSKCETCGHEWTSHRGAGTPNQCPKVNCRSKKLTLRALEVRS
jgi:predicted Zn-ribbon and HTH transcriptional regulator